MTETIVRPLRPSDKAEWTRLWRLYLGYYKTERGDEMFELAFARLMSGDKGEYRGLVAERHGKPVGLAHYLFQRHGWKIEPVCYLQDLYVDTDARGTGVGRALIEAVYDAADNAASPAVFWLTETFNAPARKLYDRVAKLTPFILYDRAPASEPQHAGQRPDNIVVRPLQPDDKPLWCVLWRRYLDYYETQVTDEVYEIAFERLMSQSDDEFHGLLAEQDGKPVGLTHYLFHRDGWNKQQTCYLQDLFTDQSARGAGVARALMEAVFAKADAAGRPDVYWLTQDFNATARKLYDRIGTLSPLIRYNRP